MPLGKEAKEQDEIRKKKNRIRVVTWVIVALALFLYWYFAK